LNQESDILQVVSDHESTPKAESEKPSAATPDAATETEGSGSHPPDAGHGAPKNQLHDLPADSTNPNLKKPSLKELLHSTDFPSRYLTILSLVFAALALTCFGILVTQYLKYRHSVQNEASAREEEARLYGGWLNGQHKFRKKAGEDGIEPLITQALGEFRASWKDVEFRADLVAECSTEEACEQLKKMELQVRDLLLPVIQASNQEEVMNPARKLALRRRLAEKLNDLNLKGQVIQIDFNDMTLESNGSRN